MKLVLTGGPSAGKTTLVEAIAREFSESVAVVPEAASLLYSGGFPRRGTPVGQKFQQRAIYYVQRELEDIVHSENQSKALVCDRGSLDGLAYWPGTPSGFLEALQTDLNSEIERYHWVIHLDTAAEASYEVTSIRTETFEKALDLNQRVRKAWEAHPRRFIIPNNQNFFEKITEALVIVREIVQGRSFEEILDLPDIRRMRERAKISK